MIMHNKMCMKLLYSVFFVFLIFHKESGVPGSVAGVGGVKIKCIERERQALLRFKREVIDGHGVLSSWGSSDCCLWKGVGCSNRTGHVTVLDLRVQEDYHSYLTGNISSSLLELPHLKYLDLSNHQFKVTLPFFIGSMNELRYLNLSNNFFLGTLSYQLGNLSKLQTLDLSFTNHLHFKSLNWLSNISSLEHLNLGWIDLSKATDWLQEVNNLPQLKTLRLSSCGLSVTVPPYSLSITNTSKFLSVLDLFNNNLTASIYPWFYNFNNSLVHLDLANNKLAGSTPPDAFRNMIFLRSLDLSFNNLQSIPSFSSNMCLLHTLHLHYNNLAGPLSESIQNLYGCTENSLEILSLSDNDFSGSLPDITRFSSMKEFDLSDNQLNSSLPRSFSQRSKLVSLSFQGSKLTGSLPDFTMFPYLEELWLGYNILVGTVSESIGSLSNLQYLDLSQNSLQGVIDEAHFSNLSKLRYLDLSDNSLALEFESDWFPPFQLEILHLRSCKLGPHFPKWLQTQTEVIEIDISSASITDAIPDWFENVSSGLIFLNLSHNQMSGKLPNILSSRHPHSVGFVLSSNKFEGPLPLFPSNTELLDLSDNMFSGSISSICEISGGILSFLDLSNNLLSGRLPDCFMHFKELVVLNLGNNNLSGEIPSSMGSLSSLQTLSLRNNSLYRELPSLKNCSKLEFLDLSENSLSGEIPAWIGESLSSLIFLSLQSNDFSGSMPFHLCQLTNIQILDLSLNNISGPIPCCLNNLTAMIEKSEKTIGCLYPVPSADIYHFVNFYINKAYVEWRGRRCEYERSLGLLRLIDISGNKLRGEIPEEVADLLQLMALNLSRYYLTGVIPQKIGELKQLESLDFSANQLSGVIPATMADLNFLSHLNVSYNYLSGRIPTSTQLQSFDASAFEGNVALCGPPLTQTCPGDVRPQEQTNDDREENEETFDDFRKWFYMGMGTGFAACFCGVSGAMLFKFSWMNQGTGSDCNNDSD